MRGQAHWHEHRVRVHPGPVGRVGNRDVADGLWLQFRDRAVILVNLDQKSPGSNAPLPGAAQLGGAFGIYSRLRLLGTDPSGWTSAPLG